MNWKKVSTVTFTSMAVLAGGWAQAAEIVVMGYRGGSFGDNYQRAVIEPFMAAHPDITVTYYGVQNAATSLGQMRAQKDAPEVNVVIYDLSVAKIAAEEGLTETLDTNALTAYPDLYDIGKELGGDAIPLTYDTLALIYNTSVFSEPPTSWSALWDVAHKGRIVFPAQGGGDIQAILMTVIANRIAGELDYKKTIEPGVELLASKMAPLIQTWEPKPDAYTLVADGTADIGIGYNARSQFYFDQTGGKVASVAPVEGTAAQINVISAIKGASEPEATLEFINYALSPEAQKAFAEVMFYGPTNSKVELDPETSARIPYTDPAVREALIPIDWMSIGDMRDSILTPWKRQIIPASR